MAQVLCPVCGGVLQTDEKNWHCAAGHSFDVARQGYVNLLTVDKKHSLHPGDTREQVAARKAFLDSGCYAPIANTLKEILALEQPTTILDAGCGEGYYLTQAAPQNSQCWGVDISKDAVRYAAVRNKTVRWFVGTAAHLPFGEESFDCILSMFALTAAEEFARVLKKGGLFVSVTAHPEHLMGLKRIIYPEILLKEKEKSAELQGFRLEDEKQVFFDFELNSGEMVQHLLSMTPHFWRISKEGAARAAETTHLEDTAKVIFRLYRKE